MWDVRDLERRLCRALDIAKKALARLAEKGYADSQEPELSVRPEKVISETALLLYVAYGAADRPQVGERLACLVETLAPHARGERTALGMCLEPALALDFAEAHLCLAKIGSPDPAFDALLHEARQSQARWGRERPPHRMLEQEWSLRMWGGEATSGRSGNAGCSALGRQMDLLSGSRDDVYAFTHALMYVTDFKVKPRGLSRSRVAVLADAEAALARCLDEQDYDLGGEVLLAWPLTGGTWSSTAAFGFKVLASVEDQVGFLPSPSTRVERLNELSGDKRADHLIATAYHTAYVMGLLCAAALLPGRTPPAAIPRSRRLAGSAHRLLPFVDSEAPPHWRVDFDRLGEPERDSLARFLMNVALRRKVKARDFKGIRELLAIAYEMGIAGMPAASQAAELVCRVATFASLRSTTSDPG